MTTLIAYHTRCISQIVRVVGVVAFVLFCAAANAEPARGRDGIAATGHPLATRAAVEAMARGGNAVDAAVAAALTLGVVDGANSGIGGGCFLLIRTAGGECVAIDGRETAPQAVTRETFLREGKADTRLSQTGALASGVPGALAAYDLALTRYGKLPLKTHLLAAAEIAERGFVIEGGYAARLKSVSEDMARFNATRAIFFKSDAGPLGKGDTLKQADLAATYRNIAQHGIAWFYEGPFAAAAAQWMSENGGLLSREDFAKYNPVVREPVRSTYRGHEVIGFPPPSSGGVHVAQILNMVEPFDLHALGSLSADTIHVIAEAMKLAFADRAHWLGDPAFARVPRGLLAKGGQSAGSTRGTFARVPRGLLAKDYARKLAEQIHMDRASSVAAHGTPEDAAGDVFKHTTHLSTADAEGNWVACTATINTTFGSKVVVPGTGVMLNNEMDDFSLQPGVPNAFKLIGGEANAVAPGKRPLSSMSPTIVLKDGQPILAVGAAGGPTIISQTLLTIINTVDFGMNVEAALGGARFHHQWMPDELRIEDGVDAAVLKALRLRGHTVSVVRAFGVCQAVARDRGRKTFTGASDPRGAGKAAGSSR